jgi:hypothetical protein
MGCSIKVVKTEVHMWRIVTTKTHYCREYYFLMLFFRWLRTVFGKSENLKLIITIVCVVLSNFEKPKENLLYFRFKNSTSKSESIIKSNSWAYFFQLLWLSNHDLSFGFFIFNIFKKFQNFWYKNITSPNNLLTQLLTRVDNVFIKVSFVVITRHAVLTSKRNKFNFFSVK